MTRYPLHNHFEIYSDVKFIMSKEEILKFTFFESNESVNATPGGPRVFFSLKSNYTDVTDILLKYYDIFYGMEQSDIRKILLLYIKGSCNFPDILYDKNLRKILL